MGKITDIFTDNAVNTRNASTVTFPIPSTEDDVDEKQQLEVQNLWEALSEEDSGDVTMLARQLVYSASQIPYNSL